MNRVVLLAGGNLGNRKENLEKAEGFIKCNIGVISRRSSVYETEPWGFEHEKNFLNQAFEVKTGLNPSEILDKIHSFEKDMGKLKRTGGYLARTMDIDIIFFNEEIIRLPDLIIPHPRLQERKFVLEPLNEICPGFIHPVLNETISVLNRNCPDDKTVKKI